MANITMKPVVKSEKVKSLESAIDALKFAEKYIVSAVTFAEGNIRHQEMNKLLWQVHMTMKELSPAISTLENILRNEEGEKK